MPLVVIQPLWYFHILIYLYILHGQWIVILHFLCDNFEIVMGPSQDSASTRLWLSIFWPTRTQFFWKSQDSDSIGLDFLRLGLARTQKVSLVMGPSEDSASTRLWLGIFWPTCTRFFWKSQDSDSIGLDFLRLGLNFFWLNQSLVFYRGSSKNEWIHICNSNT